MSQLFLNRSILKARIYVYNEGIARITASSSMQNSQEAQLKQVTISFKVGAFAFGNQTTMNSKRETTYLAQGQYIRM